jgi:hypothetical protein
MCFANYILRSIPSATLVSVLIDEIINPCDYSNKASYSFCLIMDDAVSDDDTSAFGSSEIACRQGLRGSMKSQNQNDTLPLAAHSTSWGWARLTPT